MNHLFTADELEFQDKMRSEIRALLPPHLAQRTRKTIHLSRDDMAEWNRLLHEKGWAAHHWPEEYGGTGWDPVRRFLFEAECAQADAPPISVFGLYLVGPTLHAFGSEAQKARYLPGILDGSEFWCQGYSEPDAGSDLASLQTTARRTDKGWVLNGTKAWTTEGHFADLMICLARTDSTVKPQAGLSLFIVPMDSPGVELSPVITMDGAHSVNTTFLTDVELPEDALIGEAGKGWTYAKFLLSHERTNNAQVHRSRREYERLQGLAEVLSGPFGPVACTPAIAQRLAEIGAELAAVELTVLRVLTVQTAGQEPGPEASILKLLGSELQQAISELAMDVLGEAGVTNGADLPPSLAAEARAWAERHLFRRVVTIYAGTNEVQRTIIARSVLGM